MKKWQVLISPILLIHIVHVLRYLSDINTNNRCMLLRKNIKLKSIQEKTEEPEWECQSMVDHLSSMAEVLVCSLVKQNLTKEKKKTPLDI